MDLLSIIGLIAVLYVLVYLIYPWFSDCDLGLAYYERFGKPIDSLKDKVVWITGASSGIGENLAYVLAKAGCRLILTARRKELLENVKLKCLEDNPQLQDSDIEVLVLDMCDFSRHESSFNHVLSKYGTLDILVNNAGRSQRAEWEKIELNVDKEMFDLDVFSVVNLSRLVVKHFLEKKKGHIVVTSSLAGLEGVPFSASYTGAKHALHGYFNALRMEKITQNINVTMVVPGPIQTPFLAEAFTDTVGEKYGKDTEVDESKVKAYRCATLMAVGIANNLEEIWITKKKTLLFAYAMKYYPNFTKMVIKSLGASFLMKLRDPGQAQKKQEDLPAKKD